MARARNIKPGFFKNEDLADLGPHVQLLFAGLWCLADREGILEDRPRYIKAELFPYYDMDVNGGLTLLHGAGFVKRYKVDGKPLIHILKFAEHQSPHNTERKSTLPGPDVADEEEQDANPRQSTASEVNGGLTVDSRKHNDGNPPDSLIPDSSNTDSLIPDSLRVPATAGAVAGSQKQPKVSKPKPETETSETWASYSEAYRERYRTEPVRNATVNSQMAQFVRRLGIEEAPHVARFYVGHQNAFYVRNMHTVGNMLNDAEKLRTEWATKTTMTATRAQQIDRTQTNLDAFGPLLAEARAREASNG
jgi:hypothetical protein